jgi:hypothetical protein
MPLAFILRFLARLALLGIGGAIRRGSVPPAWRTPGQTAQPPVGGRSGRPEGIPEGGVAGALGRALAGRLGTAMDVGRILAHLIAVLVFLAAASTLIAAGTTLTALGPRWVGVILLVLAALAALVTIGELRTTIRLRDAWRRRRDAERLRSTPTQLPPPA